MIKKFIIIISLCTTLIFISSCAFTKNIKIIKYIEQNIDNIWGLDEILIIGKKDYIKYTDNYRTRSHINYELNWILFETISNNNPKKCLQRAIIHIFSLRNNTVKININFYKHKYLKNSYLDYTLIPYKIIDKKEKSIVLCKNVLKFIDYILKSKTNIRINSNNKKIYFIKITFIPNKINKKQINKYINIIHNAATRYCIDKTLILSIIQIESNFNPDAISKSNALGLMQIIQDYAGRDVFKMQKKSGKPSRNYLLDPVNNINIGTAYLFMLKYIYMNKIHNPISLHYIIIASYNCGIKNCLTVFSKDCKKAIKIVNNMPSSYVYYLLFTQHPSLECRKYLYKVHYLHKNIFYKC